MLSARGRALVPWLAQRFAFTCRGNVIAATWAVVALAVAAALLLGQDANWDLRNYHRYNGYAVLHGRLLQDLAPAQMQSYFSPLLDIVHYLLMDGLPAPLAAVVLGGWHGLAFLPLAGIAWIVLAGQPQRAVLAPLLAFAGLCSGAFLSELGTSMADSSTALPVLAAVYFVLAAHAQPDRRGRLPRLLLAGALIGVAVALKLTNAVYAVGLAALLLALPGSLPQRGGRLLLVSGSALLVAVLLVGWWYWRLWQVFGNPLFPQFNAIFQAPLAAPISVADTRWLPRNGGEQLLWPVVFTFFPRRVSEVSLTQCLWLAAYLLVLVNLWQALRGRRLQARVVPAMAATGGFVLVAYLCWQLLFSIHRYLVVAELLLPLLLWWLLQRVIPPARAAKAGKRVLVLCAAVSLLGWPGWGHERWAWQAFDVQPPSIPVQDGALVLLVGDEPQGWRVPSLPAQARYVSVASNFPESDVYRERVQQWLQAAPQAHAMVPGPSDKLARRFARINAWAGRLGWDRQPDCARLAQVAQRFGRLRAQLVQHDDGRCALAPAAWGTLDHVQLAEQLQTEADQRLQVYGVRLRPGSCEQRASRIGQGSYPYQWCALEWLR